ncbi:MAG: PPC domain-containing protein [Verrucomicrobiales bacterium]|nr:PPC domain-containing protein [Verrucomicrobiales bacterium]
MNLRFVCCLLFFTSAAAFSQQVTLPLPRLLTVMPMGGQVGTEVEVTITGENIEEVSALTFSTPKIAAKPVADATNKFRVSIAADAPVGIYDARLMSRLGVSSARAFSVNRLTEVTRSKPNNSVETALALPLNSICNAAMTKRAVDFYSFAATKGKRVAVDCAAMGIDSKLMPVVILADMAGHDLLVNRTGGLLDFDPPADGTYLIKVNDLTFQGGATHFYRLALQEVSGDKPAARQPLTAMVSSMSWPPVGLAAQAKDKEIEPNNKPAEVQKISLPCDIAGAFFPAADVDTFEFAAKKGETWWVELASERLGLDTDAFVLVQQVKKDGDKETLMDVAELYDIAPPMKVSSNGYSYDGPPYNAGSPDVNGKFEIKEDGTYRLQVRDLFGGTRSDPNNVYRLIVRQAMPDFSLAAWALHMTLRNGDRNALSKPVALRAGMTAAFEVVVVRRDGFEGEIELSMDDLPPGVHATGLKIAKGKTMGHMIITADEGAKPAFALAKITGSASINGATVTRASRLASMEWPSRNAKDDIPAPRLMADMPVSVTDAETAPLSIAAAEDKVWEAKVGETLKIPLKATWRQEFTGTSIKLKAYGDGFTGLKEFDLPIKAATQEAVIDLAALKVPAGEYTIAFYGIGICKYVSGVPDAKGKPAAPTDTVDIYVSKPIRIAVKEAAVTAAK